MAKVVRLPGRVNYDDIRQIMRQVSRLKLLIGWLESARYDAHTPVAYVAAIQEYGAPQRGIPPRSFLRPTIQAQRIAWIKTLKEEFRLMFKNKGNPKQVLDRFGFLVEGQIRKAIASLREPPLSLVTLALRKRKLEGYRITGTLVGRVAAAIAAGETGKGELGDYSGINPKPLVFTGFMLASLTHTVS